MPGWEDELERWLMPFMDRLSHESQDPAADLSSACCGIDRSERSQERSAP